jgi:hypothetical protein
MLLNNHKLKFIIALMVMFAVGYICSSNKDDKKEDSKKEDMKKEDTKKEDTKEGRYKKKIQKEKSFKRCKSLFREEYTRARK